MRSYAESLLAAITAAIFFAAAVPAATAAPDPKPVPKSTADHGKFKELDKDFTSGPEVTKACLTCHTNAAKQVMQTEHWNWEYVNPKTHKVLGKRHVINDFCTSAESNENHCAECHIGYNYKDPSFKFSAQENQENVDCLVCHDGTGRYKKDGDAFGDVKKGVNLKLTAQSVRLPSRENCGECHFNGGGGDGVKHGDLDTSMIAPDKALDVHMDAKGLNFECVTCHKTESHQVSGSRYAPTAMDKHAAMIRGEKAGDRNPATCQACHGQTPHKIAKINDHTNKLACQTCHIPAFARGGQPTKMSWDWSTAGKRGPDGKPFITKDDDGYELYHSGKGDATWKENVTPEYIWFNGTVNWLTLGDKVDKSKEPVTINAFEGSPTDGKSMIWPVKVFRGKQVFDPVGGNLVVTHLSGTDDTAFWKNLDWNKAVTAGMKAANMPFSGKIDFIATQTIWPITHMVSPKDKALGCVDCHVNGGRLEKVDGVYMPGRGRDHWALIDIGGWALAGLALAAVLIHGFGRFIAHSRNS